MVEEAKLETLAKSPVEQGKQVFMNTDDRVGDNPNKMVIGSGTSFKGSDINTDYIEVYGKVETSVRAKIIFVGSSAEIIGSVTCDQIEIHGSISGGIQVNGKATIKKTATVVGTLRYQIISVEEGASVYSDLHCTNADQKLIDKISHLKKSMGNAGLNNAKQVAENKEPIVSEAIKPDKETKKKRSFFS